MTAESAAIAMAAAIAAAAELAKNGGISLFDQMSAKKAQDNVSTPNLVSSSPEPEDAEEISSNKRLKIIDESGKDSSNDTDAENFEGEEDAEKRLARSRERNREHARRTRLRKKAQLEALQSKAKGLEAESRILKQSVEECSVASILVGLSSGDEHQCSVTDSLLDATKFNDKSTPKVSLVVGGKRKRFVSEDSIEKAPQPLKLNIDGQTTLIGGGKTHINWKSGVYCDESGAQRQLTQEQLESLRRERNRMHAKMTRDRKKCFIAAIEKTIDQLESDNQKMREVLAKVAKHHFGPNAVVTPHASPLIKATNDATAQSVGGNKENSQSQPPVAPPSDIQEKMGGSPVLTNTPPPTTMIDLTTSSRKPNRVPHGFSLTAP